MVVLPTPGPPVMTVTFPVSTWATAARCEAARVRPVCCSTQGMALAGSRAPQGGVPSSRCRSCVATPTSARYSGASMRQGWPSMASAMRRSSWTSRVIACTMVVSGISSSVVAASMSSAWTTAQWPSSAKVCSTWRTPGLGTDDGIAGNAQALRQRIGRLEADAVDVQGQAVGILLHPGDGLGAVGLVDAHGTGRAHAMAMQKHHDLAHDFLLGPGGDHAGGALGADAVEFLQALRRLRDDVEDLGAEGLHQFAGKVRADAFDHAGAEVSLDAFQRGGGHDAQLRGLELQAMGAVGDPPPLRFDIFPWGDASGPYPPR